MFNKQEDKGKDKNAETIIGQSVNVRGDFNSNGNIIIEGSVEGSINTTGNLYIGDEANIIANISADDARVGGRIKGDIKITNYLEISSSAKIDGNIECSIISIEKGAILNGVCTMNNKNTNTSLIDNNQ